ncbi:MAG: trypsin-like peptidase domain-containing protein, partial [Acidobacteriota bacterium]
YVPLGDSDALAANQPVEGLGFPFGRRGEVAQTSVPDIVPRVSTSRGSVSAVRTREDGMTQFIQTSATVNPGNSGGPMVDEEGYALGVVRLSLAEASGIGFVIPINVVKDFLEEHGLGPLLPVQRLRLDRMGNLEGKGLRLRLVEGQEDRSATRVRVRAGASPDEVELVTHRVVSPWSLRRLEEELLSGRSFGTFEASGFGKPQSTASGDGKVVVGFANGHSPKNLRLKMEYALYDLGKEKVVAHYTGPADQVAFNRSVLRESLTSLDVEPLLTDELDRPIRVDDPEAIRWVEAPLPAPPAPRVALPPGWVQEVAVPIACPGLASPDSALAASLRGDFTVSFRAAWWQSGPRSGEAASACSSRPGKLGADSYVSAAEWLGASYSVEGIFLESASGLLQLEAVAPDEKIGFVRDLFRAWVAKNRGHKLEALLFSFLVTHRSRLASSEAGISKAELLQPSGCSRGSPHPRGFDRDRDPRCPESSASSALSSL